MTPGVAIITGASSGLGAEMARQLATKGWSVGLIARREDRLIALADEIAPARSAISACDVTDREALTSAIAEIERALGPTDVLVANAGLAAGDAVAVEDPEDFERMFRVNVFGAYYAVKAVLPGMLARGRGQLVGISSLAALRGVPSGGGYSATKAALSNWLEAIRLELRPRGIRVTTIQPGFVRSEMTDQNDTKMPFFLETAPAVRRILKAIAKRKATYDFPKRASWLLRLVRLLPDGLVRKIAGKAFAPVDPQ